MTRSKPELPPHCGPHSKPCARRERLRSSGGRLASGSPCTLAAPLTPRVTVAPRSAVPTFRPAKAIFSGSNYHGSLALRLPTAPAPAPKVLNSRAHPNTLLNSRAHPNHLIWDLCPPVHATGLFSQEAKPTGVPTGPKQPMHHSPMAEPSFARRKPHFLILMREGIFLEI